jgi:hypothetical protein
MSKAAKSETTMMKIIISMATSLSLLVGDMQHVVETECTQGY